jgi:hypothetical protein
MMVANRETVVWPRLCLKSCPHCKGDLMLDIEEGNAYGCLQCGRKTRPRMRPPELVNLTSSTTRGHEDE